MKIETKKLHEEMCCICNKPAIKYEQALSRWFDNEKKEVVAHFECDLAQQRRENNK